MPVFSVQLFEGAAGLGVHQVEEGADAEIAFEIGTLGRAECVILVPGKQVFDAGDVVAGKVDIEESLSPDYSHPIMHRQFLRVAAWRCAKPATRERNAPLPRAKVPRALRFLPPPSGCAWLGRRVDRRPKFDGPTDRQEVVQVRPAR
jgi:hypothetical protein